jgi:alkylation response protein AidB-like acyl-CoA dehydrogenase
VDLLLSADEEAIVASVSGLLTGSALADPDASWPDQAWKELAAMGVFGLAVTEGHGGLGFGVAGEVLLYREFGRQLARGPLLGTTLATQVALGSGAAELAESLISGSVTCGYAEPLAGSSPAPGDSVSGTFRVWEGGSAALLVLVTPQWSGLIQADRLGTEGLSVTPLPQIDTSVGMAQVTLTDVPLLAQVPGTGIATRAALLVAGMQTGIAEAALAESAAYAVTREQFGKPIGTFQAVKHRCADMAVRAEAARFQTVYAALAWDDPALQEQAAGQVAAAAAVAADAGRRNSADNIQNHGAMGFTLEASPHRYLRRTLVLASLLGTPRAALEQIAARA